MKNIIILIACAVLGTNLLYAKNSRSNFEIKESCLIDIQKKQDSFIDKYYTTECE